MLSKYFLQVFNYKIPHGVLPFLCKGIVLTVLFTLSIQLESRSEEILIFSPVIGDEESIQIDEKTGKFEVVISAFSPIMSISINNKDFPTSKTKKFRRSIQIEYSLDSESKVFSIDVQTEEGERTKKITLYLNQKEEHKKKEEKKNWGLILFPALETLDNAEDAPWGSNRIQATRLSIILIPTYIKKVNDTSHLIYKGLLLRENFFSDEEISTETVFSQLTLALENSVSWGNWNSYIGGGNIGTQSTGPYGLSGAEIEEEDNLFLGGKTKLNLNTKSFLGTELRFTLKKMKTIVSPSHDETGRLISLQFNGGTTFSTLKGTLGLGAEQNDVRGKYQDYQISNVVIGSEYPFDSKKSIKLVLTGRKMSFAEYDPFKQEKESTTLLTGSLKGVYSLNNPFNQKLFLELKRKEQTSNVSMRGFQTTSLSFSSLFIF